MRQAISKNKDFVLFALASFSIGFVLTDELISVIYSL